MSAPVRVRFAPSPTGSLHVGGARTALFNYLFARHSRGVFILRIEDTDRARFVAGSVEDLMESLKWLGLDWDEGPDVGGAFGPYFQSQRLPSYQAAAEKLVAQGDAYYCYCSPERLDAMRKDQMARKLPTGYDRACRGLSRDDCARYEADGVKPVVRFKVPDAGRTGFTDAIYGDIVFDNRSIDDFVMLKSDGYPTYHLANVIDDHAMKISHVIRAEEWLSSTPRHLLMYKAFGFEPPLYAHVPDVLGNDRRKLSKRHGDVALSMYREKGYLPEAMFNFLSLLGWSLDDKTDLMTPSQVIDAFSLDRVSKTGGIFNTEKLDWMNGVYIRGLSLEDFTSRAMPFLEKSLGRKPDPDFARKVMPLVQERAKILADVPALAHFFFVEALAYDPKLLVSKGMTAASTLRALEASSHRLSLLPEFDEASLEALLRPLAEELGLKAGQLFSVLRTAVTGEVATPPLFQTMVVLGKDRCLKRLKEAVAKLRGLSS